MHDRTLLTDLSDRVLTVRLNRPEQLNAFTPAMGHDLMAVLDDADRDDGVRVVIVTGQGRAFCAGMDLSAGGSTFDGSAERTLDTHRDEGGQLTLRIFEMRKPVIAAINGPAVGVGVTMTLPMDIRIAAESARLGFVFTRRGIVTEAASSWFLPRIVGMEQALEWVLSGRVFGAAEALRGRLVSRVVPDHELLTTATSLAGEIAAHTSAVSIGLCRQMLWRMQGAAGPREAHLLDSKAMFHMGRSADAAEGVTSFLEKRPACFPMRLSTDWPDFLPWPEKS